MRDARGARLAYRSAFLPRTASSATTFPARPNRRASSSRASCATTSNRPAAAAALSAPASAA